MNILPENTATYLVKYERENVLTASNFGKGVAPLLHKKAAPTIGGSAFLSPDFSGQATFIS